MTYTRHIRSLDDVWNVVSTVAIGQGACYYIQNKETGRTATNLDGSEVFRTRDGHLADTVCERLNKEANAKRADQKSA